MAVILYEILQKLSEKFLGPIILNFKDISQTNFYWHSTTFPYLSRYNWSAYHIAGGDFIFAIDISPCPLLLEIVSHLFLSRDCLKICGLRNLPSALEIINNRSVTKFLWYDQT